MAPQNIVEKDDKKNDQEKKDEQKDRKNDQQQDRKNDQKPDPKAKPKPKPAPSPAQPLAPADGSCIATLPMCTCWFTNGAIVLRPLEDAQGGKKVPPGTLLVFISAGQIVKGNGLPYQFSNTEKDMVRQNSTGKTLGNPVSLSALIRETGAKSLKNLGGEFHGGCNLLVFMLRGVCLRTLKAEIEHLTCQ